ISEVISDTIDNYAELQKKYADLEKEYHQVLDDYLIKVNECQDLEEEVRELRHSENVQQQVADQQAEMRREQGGL
ncbi:hypothetical protein LCGC14_2667140, partial [marine sediment metagenome]